MSAAALPAPALLHLGAHPALAASLFLLVLPWIAPYPALAANVLVWGSTRSGSTWCTASSACPASATRRCSAAAPTPATSP